MKAFAVATFMCAAALLCAQSASAQTTTYRYTGKPFTMFSCGPNDDNTATLDCATPAPANTFTSYVAGNLVTGTMTFDAPLPANLPLQDVRGRAGFQLSLNDGQHTVALADAVGIAVEIATDGSGEINQWRVILNTGGVQNGGISTINTTFTGDTGVLACCDPTVSGNLGQNNNAAGIWSSAATRCEIQLNSSTFVNGSSVIANVIRFSNLGATPAPVEVKIWLQIPGLAPYPVLRGGADGSAVMTPNSVVNLGPSTLFAVSAAVPRGTYGYSCRVVDPVTGKLQSESLQSFVVQ